MRRAKVEPLEDDPRGNWALRDSVTQSWGTLPTLTRFADMVDWVAEPFDGERYARTANRSGLRSVAEPFLDGTWTDPRGDGPFHTIPSPWSCPHPTEVSEDDVDLVVDDGLRQVFVPIGVSNPVQPQLILLLHGNMQEPDKVKEPAQAFARAGFRTISLWWFAENFRADCVQETATDGDYNDCLVDRRDDRLYNASYGIVWGLQETLKMLANTRAGEGWDQFLQPAGDWNGDVPDWSKIILAGYSQGANQAAYLMRQVDVHGVILISGGGDVGTRAESFDLAEWMTQLDEDPRVVGFRNVNEVVDYTQGWLVDGVPLSPFLGTQAVAETSPYTVFQNAHMLARTDGSDIDDAQQAAAHLTTVNVPQPLSHMYLACLASSGEAPE